LTLESLTLESKSLKHKSKLKSKSAKPELRSEAKSMKLKSKSVNTFVDPLSPLSESAEGELVPFVAERTRRIRGRSDY
jgi:hypothetical protein